MKISYPRSKFLIIMQAKEKNQLKCFINSQERI